MRNMFDTLEDIIQTRDMACKYEKFLHLYENIRALDPRLVSQDVVSISHTLSSHTFPRSNFSHTHFTNDNFAHHNSNRIGFDFAHTKHPIYIQPFTPAQIQSPRKLRAKSHKTKPNPSVATIHIAQNTPQAAPLCATHTSIAKALHAIAHIEYSAITLALDSAYRFRHLPYAYYVDWLEVADEEFRHFFLLERLLGELGVRYGDFPVHTMLYDAMLATNDSLLYRMGVVHRGLEAKGLDANPFVLQKIRQLLCANTHLRNEFRAFGDEVERVFDVILRDEIAHASKGDKWWRFAIDKALESSTQMDCNAVDSSTLHSNVKQDILSDIAQIVQVGQYPRMLDKASKTKKPNTLDCNALESASTTLESTTLDSTLRRTLYTTPLLQEMIDPLAKLLEKRLDISDMAQAECGVLDSSGAYHWSERAFLALCARFSHISLCGKIIHTQARLQAGFRLCELEKLQAFYELMARTRHKLATNKDGIA